MRFCEIASVSGADEHKLFKENKDKRKRDDASKKRRKKKKKREKKERKKKKKEKKEKKKTKEEGRGWVAVLGHCFVLEWNGILRNVTAVSVRRTVPSNTKSKDRLMSKVT